MQGATWQDAIGRPWRLSYTAGGESLTLSVRAPVAISGHDGHQALATPIVIGGSLVGGSHDIEVVAHVAADGRLVRFDRSCFGVWADCRHYAMSWQERGILPPLGFGWPVLLDSLSPANKHLAATSLSWTRVGDEWHVQADQPSDVHPILSMSGTFAYRDGRPFPDTMVMTLGNLGRTMIHLDSAEVTGPPHGMPDMWPAENWTLPESSSRPFRGGSEPVGGWSFAIRDALAALENNSEASTALDSGCITSVILLPPSHATIAGQAISASTIISISIETPTATQRWRINHEDGMLGSSFSVQRDAGTGWQSGCHGAGRSGLSWGAGYEAVKRLLREEPDDAAFAWFLGQQHEKWSWVAAPASFQVNYRPPWEEGLAYIPYQVQVSAVDGTLELLVMDVDEARRLAGG